MTREQRRAAILDTLGPDTFERYQGYIDVVLRSRLVPRTIVRMVNDLEHERLSIAAGKCPKCSAPIKRYDSRETERLRASAGLGNMPPTDSVGGWVMYRCSTQPPPGTPRSEDQCDFMLDRFESEEAN